MHGHTIALYASAALLSLVSAAEGAGSRTVPNYRLQRRSYRHNEDLRMRIRRSASNNGDNAGAAHVLKARFTPPPGEAEEPVATPAHATPTGVLDPGRAVELPNASPAPEDEEAEEPVATPAHATPAGVLDPGRAVEIPNASPAPEDEEAEEPVTTPAHATPAGVLDPGRPVEIPNASPGINTPDNVAPDTWTEDAGCAAYYAAKSGDICNSILEQFGQYATTLDTFYAINPSVDEECTNLVVGQAYCVALSTPANVAPDTLTVEEGCLRYQTIQAGDFCLSVVSENTSITGITLDQFYESNPSLDAECSNLWAGYGYCVGLQGGVPVYEVPKEDGEEEDVEDVDCPPRRRVKL